MPGSQSSFVLQSGVSVTLSGNVDAQPTSNYTLMLPGYVNPFVTFYSVTSIINSPVKLFANITTGFKLLPYTTATISSLLSNSFIQYYAGLGVGLKYSKYVSINIQYNRLYHDITDHSRENFRNYYQGRNLHGSYVDVSLRVYPFTTQDELFALFTEMEWRGLGKSYQYNKTLAFGLGITFRLGMKPLNSTERIKLTKEINQLKKEVEVLKKNVNELQNSNIKK